MKPASTIILILFLVVGICGVVYAGPAEVQSIQISPAETAIGQRPQIIGSISGGSVRGEVTVIAVVVLPDHTVKSWTWKNIVLGPGEVKKITVPQEYEAKLAGVYKVDFNIYSKDMRPIHRLSRTFVVKEASEQTAVAAGQPKPAKEAAGAAETRRFGIGAFGNAANPAGGATIVVWSSKFAGLQGSYSTGKFTTVEGRLLFRLPLSSGFNPYLGIGYASVSTERTVEILNQKATFRDEGVSGVVGVELPLSRSLVGYAEVCGANIDLKKIVGNGTISGTASVKYAPVSVGAGIIWYLF